MSKIIGIDISKQTFDVSFLKKDKWEHKVFKNVPKGFQSFKKLIEKQQKEIDQLKKNKKTTRAKKS